MNTSIHPDQPGARFSLTNTSVAAPPTSLATSATDKVQEKEPISKAEKMRTLARQTAFVVGAIAFSPVILLVAAVAIHIPKVWTMALLPSVGKEIPPLYDSYLNKYDLHSRLVTGLKIPFGTEGKNGTEDKHLAAMMVRPKGMTPAESAQLPVAILFCQNSNIMQDDRMLKRANEYSELGFNVVLFNYRGVGGSEGTPTRGEDLIADGEAVVNAVLAGKIKGLPEMSSQNVVLDGTSMGGAVALAVGKKHLDMMISANHTFSHWNAAAGSLVGNRTAPIIGKFVEKLVSAKGRADVLDNRKAMAQRDWQQKLQGFEAELIPEKSFSDHAVTVVQTAGQDEILNPYSRLKLAKGLENVNETVFENLTHDAMPGFQSKNVESIMQRDKSEEEPIREDLKKALQPIMGRHKEVLMQAVQNRIEVYKEAQAKKSGKTIEKDKSVEITEKDKRVLNKLQEKVLGEILEELKLLKFGLVTTDKADLEKLNALKADLEKIRENYVPKETKKASLEENEKIVQKHRKHAKKDRLMGETDSHPNLIKIDQSLALLNSVIPPIPSQVA